MNETAAPTTISKITKPTMYSGECVPQSWLDSSTTAMTTIGSFVPDSASSVATSRLGKAIVRSVEKTAAASVDATTPP